MAASAQIWKMSQPFLAVVCNAEARYSSSTALNLDGVSLFSTTSLDERHSLALHCNFATWLPHSLKNSSLPCRVLAFLADRLTASNFPAFLEPGEPFLLGKRDAACLTDERLSSLT